MPKQRSNRKAKKSVNYGAMAPIFVAVLVVLAVGIFILYDVSGASGKLNGNMGPTEAGDPGPSSGDKPELEEHADHERLRI